MKIRFALMSLTLVATCGLSDLSAQSSQEKKDQPAKPDTTVPTRPRRSDEVTTATLPSDSSGTVAPDPAKALNNSSIPNGNQDKKDIERKEATENVEPVDVFAALKNKIDAAHDDSERLSLRLELTEEFIKAGRKAEAINELRSISDMDVFYPQGFYNAGNDLARLGETASAIDVYRKAIEQRKGNYSRAYNNLGVVLIRAGRWDEAHDALLSAMKLENFLYAEASYNLGRLYAAQGQSDLAAREWRRTIKINPKHAAAAEALRRLDSDDRVVVVPRAKTVRAGVARAASKPPAMTESRTLELDQTSFDYLQRARTANEKGKSGEAIDNYKRLLSRQTGYFPPANLELSFVLLGQQRYDEALSNLHQVASRDGGRFPISYYHLGRVYEIRGDLKQAEVWYSQAATSFGSDNPQFLLDVSRVREKQGDYEGALDSMERYLALMQQKGERPSWSNDRLTALRQKAVAAPKN